MSIKLTREQALILGKSISINSDESAKLPPGERGSCQINSAMFVRNHPGSFYCLGFVAGFQNEYEPHAWVKQNGNYLECSPQDGTGHKYILSKEMTYKDILQAVKDAGIDASKGFIPPLLDDSGNFMFMNPDLDATLAK